MRKLIVVTGGSQGIGRAIIEKFAAHHFDVVTCARSSKDLADMKRDVEKKYPGVQVHYEPADMASKSQVKKFTDFALMLDRPVDILVNNAGFFIPGEITTEPDGTLERMIEANLYSAYHTTRGLINSIKKNIFSYF